MQLTVVRKYYTDTSTIGHMFIDDVFECFTLEDAVRRDKVYGKTAIPSGIYMVQITPSKRFKKDLPLLMDVPNFQGIRIHPGNTAENTEGCILVGTEKGEDIIYNSQKAFASLMEKLKKADGLTYIEILDTANKPEEV